MSTTVTMIATAPALHGVRTASQTSTVHPAAINAMTAAILLFVSSLVLSTVSSVVLSELLDRVAGFELPEGIVGLLTAFGADSPEIAAAITAVTSGSGSLGVRHRARIK